MQGETSPSGSVHTEKSRQPFLGRFLERLRLLRRENQRTSDLENQKKVRELAKALGKAVVRKDE